MLGLLAVRSPPSSPPSLPPPWRRTARPHLMLELKDGTVDIELLPDLAPQARRAHRRADQRGLLQRHRLPPRDRRLHGPDRRSDRHRHGRLAPARTSRPSSTAERFVRGTARRGPHQRPQHLQLAVLHHLRRCRFLNGQYTVFGKVVVRHGVRRHDQEAGDEPRTAWSRTPTRSFPPRSNTRK